MAGGLKPITDFDGHREWLQQAVRNFLVPATLTIQIERIDIADGCVVAVNIPPSLHLVSLWDQQVGTIECVYRTNHGKAYMNPNEAERHLMNGSRAAALAFAEAVADCGGTDGGLSVKIVSGVAVRENATGVTELGSSSTPRDWQGCTQSRFTQALRSPERSARC